MILLLTKFEKLRCCSTALLKWDKVGCSSGMMKIYCFSALSAEFWNLVWDNIGLKFDLGWILAILFEILRYFFCQSCSQGPRYLHGNRSSEYMRVGACMYTCVNHTPAPYYHQSSAHTITKGFLSDPILASALFEAPQMYP